MLPRVPTSVPTAVVAALALSALPAHGQSSFRDFFVCGGNAFNTCAAVALTVGPTTTAGLSDVTMQVWNLSGLGGTWGATVFTKIGFYNTGSAVALGPLTMSGPVRGTDAPALWQLGDPNSAGGVSLELVTSANGGSSSVDNALANACDPANLPSGSTQLWQNPCAAGLPALTDAGWVTMSFQVEGNWDLTTTEMLIQGQNGPDGMSTQCITGENCSVVPEPSTVLLLATGLAGVAGVGLRRRRQERAEGSS